MSTIGSIRTNVMHHAVSQGTPLADGTHHYHERIAFGVIRGRQLRSQSFRKFIHRLISKTYRTLIKYRLI